MKTLSLCAALAALALPVAAQKMATPAGEAPGPWILGTIGVGKTADPKIPQTTALKGLAIRVGEKGEAAVAYDLDLCRMVGAWTGKFTTPMNLMSRGEYPTAMGEVAFTTGEVPGFLLGHAAVPPGQGSVPPGNGSVPLRDGIVPPPRGIVPAPSGNDPAPRNDVLPASGTDTAARRDVPPASGNDTLALGSHPPALGNDPAASGNASVAQSKAPAVQSNSPVSQSNPPTGWQDPRPEPFGPLPPGQARFKGFYVFGNYPILKWDIGGVELLEQPQYLSQDGVSWFSRTLDIGESGNSLTIAIQTLPEGDLVAKGVLPSGWSRREGPVIPDAVEYQVFRKEGRVTVIAVRCIVPDRRLEVINGQVCLSFRPKNGVRWAGDMEIRVWTGAAGEEQRFIKTLEEDGAPRPLRLFVNGGPARWPETVTTVGEVSDKKDEAYVVDTIKLPDPNPWGAPMFVGGFDFFPDGRAALCTFHGDVFVVSGIDAGLEQVTWRRFASGLYHALGLKIVNGEIYVTCRDGLWRLKDLNGDGECDFYEAFNFDLKVTKNFHEFVFDLQTDPAGNFYFAKAGPVKNGGRGFDEIMAHHGTLLRVSPDGAKLEVMATGFRAPNGIGVGPRGELTSGDNEGTWTPACKINWIKPGGFCGVVDLAHRAVPPTDYDRPLCWLPKRVDNSGGSQVWVPEWAKWGPWRNRMLHLSYGTCSVFGVLKETIPLSSTARKILPNVPGEALAMQGGVTRFPVNFQSGIMRARFHPTDGQLYVGGLRGWQTTGVKNGAFQRVRFTGAPVRMPIELHATKRGVRLTFTCQLDPATATDPQNWNVEVWNYLWSGAYGSPEFSTIEPVEKPADAGKQGEAQFSKTQIAQKKHDPLTVKSATLSADGRSVFLEIPEIKPVMQMAIKFGFKAADGTELRSEVINTIHALGD